jgi:hypothetical protein
MHSAGEVGELALAGGKVMQGSCGARVYVLGPAEIFTFFLTLFLLFMHTNKKTL